MVRSNWILGPTDVDINRKYVAVASLAQAQFADACGEFGLELHL